MSQKYDEYLENHRQAVKKAYQWIATEIQVKNVCEMKGENYE